MHDARMIVKRRGWKDPRLRNKPLGPRYLPSSLPLLQITKLSECRLPVQTITYSHTHQDSKSSRHLSHTIFTPRCIYRYNPRPGSNVSADPEVPRKIQTQLSTRVSHHYLLKGFTASTNSTFFGLPFTPSTVSDILRHSFHKLGHPPLARFTPSSTFLLTPHIHFLSHV